MKLPVVPQGLHYALEHYLNQLRTAVVDLDKKTGGDALVEEDTTTPSSGKGGIFFLDSAVVIENASTSTVAWTTYDASSSLPDGAGSALIEIRGGNDSTGSQWVLARKESGAQEYMVHRCRGGGGAADDVASACQSLVPVTAAKTFDYTIVAGYSYDCTIKLIGYAI